MIQQNRYHQNDKITLVKVQLTLLFVIFVEDSLGQLVLKFIKNHAERNGKMLKIKSHQMKGDPYL